MDHLRSAVGEESRYAEWAREDSDFVGLRDDPDFVKLVA